MKMKNDSKMAHLYNEKLIEVGAYADVAECDAESMKHLGFSSGDSNEKKSEAETSPEEGK